MVRGNNRIKPNNPIKETVKKLLDGKGISYDDWLNEIHMKFIFENLEIINEGLELRKEFSNEKEEN
ncbi:hypothetical protein [Clostridium perfringens]|uniref:Uncharacterized protein n=1 Tax=Clostridium perfringens TaxID=1502 RepID=A0A2X3IH16_CLOPF|nr:hypothetical protein [Clostridium perfringens]MBO3304354.1 hypothetical protein [Clostridium perfringens]MBO3307675.1 hypothetical protein [Clostridium perfringens]MBO3311007.1 hypothetical protein [Clostridium perfringens]MBO3317308.1 hypothetical protein [Clostridium perfringens]MBO3392301.1 hypothetical protein [Clostridium perfringens]